MAYNDLWEPLTLTPPRRYGFATSAFALVGIVALSIAPAWLGALAIDQEFYDGLARGPWAPPPLAFPAIWILVQILTGVGVWQVWRTGAGVKRRLAMYWWIAEIAVAAEWMPVFFGRESTTGGLAMAVAWLVASGGVLITGAERAHRSARVLLAPFLWTAYLVLMMTAMWTMNL